MSMYNTLLFFFALNVTGYLETLNDQQSSYSNKYIVPSIRFISDIQKGLTVGNLLCLTEMV